MPIFFKTTLPHCAAAHGAHSFATIYWCGQFVMACDFLPTCTTSPVRLGFRGLDPACNWTHAGSCELMTSRVQAKRISWSQLWPVIRSPFGFLLIFFFLLFRFSLLYPDVPIIAVPFPFPVFFFFVLPIFFAIICWKLAHRMGQHTNTIHSLICWLARVFISSPFRSRFYTCICINQRLVYAGDLQIWRICNTPQNCA